MRRATVLLATWQGAKHLAAQLASLVMQEGVALRVLASDDGSTDGTRAILSDFAAQHGILAAQHEGPRRGAAANFLHLLALAEPDGGLLALCDQDDVCCPASSPGPATRCKGGRRRRPAPRSGSAGSASATRP